MTFNYSGMRLNLTGTILKSDTGFTVLYRKILNISNIG